MQKPTIKPNHPFFSSGPCSKRPGWNLGALNDAVLGRSHRAKTGKAKLNEVIVEIFNDTSVYGRKISFVLRKICQI